ncbi:MAG: ligand-binding sensor domain-containing protein [Flavisolibacter sp.]
MRTITAIFFSLFFAASACAQHAKQYSFKHFTVSNGLASNTVNATVQDADGYMWIATVNGLQRYDGNNFITFRSEENNPFSIPSTHIVSMFLDKDRNLWLIGDNDKVGIFDTRQFRFQEVPFLGKKPLLVPISFLQIPTGQLLLRAYGLLYVYEKHQNRFVPANNLFPLPKNWILNNIDWDNTRKRFWISCDSGLVQFDPATMHANYRGHNVDHDTIIETLKDQRQPNGAFADARGNIIFYYWPLTAGDPTIIRYNRQLKKTESYHLWPLVGYHEIAGSLKQRNGRLWIYGMPFFMEWTDEPQPFIQLSGENLDEPKIKYDYTYDAFEDRENNIWISTDNGIYLFNPDKQIFSTYSLFRPGDNTAQERPVTSAIQLQDGKIFIGTWGSSGIYCYDNNFNPLPLPSGLGEKGKHYTVWDMAISNKTGNLWITLQGGGVVVYDPRTNRSREVYPEVFGGSTIRQIDDDTSGNMWFGTQNGKLIKWDSRKAGNDPEKGYQLVYQAGMIYKVHYDYQGYIWIGSIGKGLMKFDALTGRLVKTFTADGKEGERLFNNSPRDMSYFDDSTLVVAAGCINIINTKTNKVRYISTREGLPSNTAISVERDTKGILWVGMNNGICRVNLKKNLVSYFDRRDGIAYDKFAETGAKQMTDGRLVFFSDHNFLVFNPATFGQLQRPPKPYLTSVLLGEKYLSIDSLLRQGRIMLDYDNTSIGIYFSALSYLQQTKVHYYYMLDGLDKNWIHTDHPIEAAYNYLPPGEYTFRVKSENTDGITSQEIASIPIVVQPPFWNTRWFYGLVLLVVIGVLYIIDRERMIKKDSLRQMRSEIASNLHTEISNTLNNINVLSEMAKIKADKNIEQSKEFIGQISDKSRHMMEAMDDMLWSIDPQNDSMRKTVLRIKELTDAMRLAYDVDIDLIVDHKIQSLELDMKLRHDLFFFYKESMNYLMESIHCRQVFVNIKQVKSKMMIEVLTECEHTTEAFKSRFRKFLEKRTRTLPSSMEITADHKSLSVVLFVNLKN